MSIFREIPVTLEFQVEYVCRYLGYKIKKDIGMKDYAEFKMACDNLHLCFEELWANVNVLSVV